MRESARELRAESYLVYWMNGSYQQAVEETSLEFSVARQTVDAAPGEIGYLVATAIDSMSVNGMRDFLYLAGPNQKVDDQIRQTLQHDWPNLDLAEAVAGEALVEFQIVESSPVGVLLGDPAPRLRVSLPPSESQLKVAQARKRLTSTDRVFLRSLADLIEARILHNLRLFYAAARQPLPQRFQAFYEATQMNEPSDLSPDLEFFADMSDMERLAFTAARATASKDVVLLGAAVLSYRARTGAFPITLEDAMPDAPLNPFDRKPYHYQKTTDGFLVSASAPGQPIPNAPQDLKSVAIEFRYPALAELRKTPENYANSIKHGNYGSKPIAPAPPQVSPDAQREIRLASQAYQHLTSFSALIELTISASGIPEITAAELRALNKSRITELFQLARPNLITDTAEKHGERVRIVSDGKQIYGFKSSSPHAYTVNHAPANLKDVLTTADHLSSSELSLSFLSDIFSNTVPARVFSNGFRAIALGTPGMLDETPIIRIIAYGNDRFYPPNSRCEFDIGKADYLLRRLVIKGLFPGAGDKGAITVTLNFRNVKSNPKLSRSSFQFVPPAGATALRGAH